MGVVKPLETVTVIKSYTNKLGPGQLRKWLQLTHSRSSHRYAARILMSGKATEFNCPTNLMKQKLLTACLSSGHKESPAHLHHTDNFPVMVTNLEDAVTEEKK